MTEQSDYPAGAFWGRILLLVGILAGFIALGKWTPLGDYLAIPYLQQAIGGSGFAGVLLFIVVFVLGSLVNIPGIAFNVFALLLFGYVNGVIITYIAALLAALFTFFFARLISGTALTQVRNVRVQKLLTRVADRPVSTLVLMRVFMLLSPFVGYTLALTSIRPRDYLVGNAIGIWIPLTAITLTVFLLEDKIEYWLGVSFG